MPITVDLYARVIVGGQIAIDRQLNLQVEAIDDVSLDVPDGAADQRVDIQPGPATDIQFIAIHNITGVGPVSYVSTVGAQPIPLADVHVYSGPGMAALLGANPTALYVTNASGQPVTLRIVVGRSA
jgi:hypothetical protein